MPGLARAISPLVQRQHHRSHKDMHRASSTQECQSWSTRYLPLTDPGCDPRRLHGVTMLLPPPYEKKHGQAQGGLDTKTTGPARGSAGPDPLRTCAKQLGGRAALQEVQRQAVGVPAARAAASGASCPDMPHTGSLSPPPRARPPQALRLPRTAVAQSGSASPPLARTVSARGQLTAKPRRSQPRCPRSRRQPGMHHTPSQRLPATGLCPVPAAH